MHVLPMDHSVDRLLWRPAIFRNGSRAPGRNRGAADLQNAIAMRHTANGSYSLKLAVGSARARRPG